MTETYFALALGILYAIVSSRIGRTLAAIKQTSHRATIASLRDTEANRFG